MTPTYSLSLKARPEYGLLHLAGRVLRALCEEAGMAGAEMDRMELALSEGLTNAIGHGRHGSVGLELAVEDGLLTMRITDQGPGFDLDAVRQPDLEHPAERGYGVFIMREVMDSVDYAPGAEGNVLVLKRRFAGKGTGKG